MKRLRIISYNVHSCRGADGRTDPVRIAQVIAECQPDVVALQEVDVGRSRSGGADQAKLIASQLTMTSHFHPALHIQGERYGDALLSALPSRVVKAGPLPSIGEPRGAIWAAFDLAGSEVHVVNTHLGLRRRERMAQILALLGPGWLGSPQLEGKPAILLGDFNFGSMSAAYKMIAREWRDVRAIGEHRARATFPARFPLLRLDHIFVRYGVTPVNSMVPTNLLARTASDHLPVVSTLDIPVMS